jgi:2-(1,2-epoxy-1,2-dihydrophenyl)acetyl-CoA isomerase
LTYKYILTEQQGSTEIITLNDPENLNAVNGDLKSEFTEELRRADSDSTVRTVIITGAGRAFCVGGNVKTFAQAGGHVQDVPMTFRQKLLPFTSGTLGSTPEMVYTLWRLSKPTIAAINGACAATGLGIAMACDIRVAAENAKFAWGFPQRALVPPEGSLFMLPLLMGYEAAFRLGATGMRLTAQEAMSHRIVGQVVSPGDLMPTCLRLGEQIEQNTPPVTLQLFKATMQELMRESFERSMIMGHHAYGLALQTADQLEAMNSFAEKRPPEWEGK